MSKFVCLYIRMVVARSHITAEWIWVWYEGSLINIYPEKCGQNRGVHIRRVGSGKTNFVKLVNCTWLSKFHVQRILCIMKSYFVPHIYWLRRIRVSNVHYCELDFKSCIVFIHETFVGQINDRSAFSRNRHSLASVTIL